MSDIFFALFGGVYTAGRILFEKREATVSKQRSDRQLERLNAWKAQVVDCALEENLRDYIRDYREAAWLEVQDACKAMRFQKNYGSADEWAYDGVLNKTKNGRKLYHRHRFEEPLDIMLAKRGKVRSDRYFLPLAHLYQGEGQRTKLEWDRTTEFWMYIRDELRRNGVEAQLIFDHGYIPGTMNHKYSSIEDINTIRYQSGDLIWITDTSIGL